MAWAARDREGITGNSARWCKFYNLYRALVKLHVSPVLYVSLQEQVEHEAVKAGLVTAEQCFMDVDTPP